METHHSIARLSIYGIGDAPTFVIKRGMHAFVMEDRMGDVPSSSLLYDEIIGEERVFIFISLWGHMMKFTLASFSFSIPSSSYG
jgi:hypothetical protein